MINLIKKLKNRKTKNKVYDFKYTVYFDGEKKDEGVIENSSIPPEDIFINNKLVCFSNGSCTYFNRDKISAIDITDLVERVGDNMNLLCEFEKVVFDIFDELKEEIQELDLSDKTKEHLIEIVDKDCNKTFGWWEKHEDMIISK